MQLNHLSPHSYQPSATMETLRNFALTLALFGLPLGSIALVDYLGELYAEHAAESAAAQKLANPSPLQLRKNYGL